MLGDVLPISNLVCLSEAFAKHPRVFDKLYVNMIKAGEAGGALEVILQRLADFKEKAQTLKRRVTGAMVYPAVVYSGRGRYTLASSCTSSFEVQGDLRRLRCQTARKMTVVPFRSATSSCLLGGL